jgi:hypothetical protein
VFLTKAERQKLALEKRAAAVIAMKAETDQPVKEEEETDKKEREKEREKDRDKKGHNDRRERGRAYDDRGRRGERDKESVSRDERRERDKEKEERDQNSRLVAREKDLIKKQYLGGKKEKKKVGKPSEKFKFVFDWDASEDTSRDINPLYNNKLDLRPMFGRGLIGGIDKKEQLKVSLSLPFSSASLPSRSFFDPLQNYRNIAASKVHSDRDNVSRSAKAKSETKEYEKQINQLSVTDLPGAHWSEKSLTSIFLYKLLFCLRF